MSSQKSLNIEFEKAVRFLAEHMPVSDENSRKPVMFHDIRVGVFLYERGYKREIVLAGVLHDAIEWSGANQEMVQKEFGDEILKLVLACTKDDTIIDKKKKTEELIRRCIENGQDALIVKTADIIDSFKWYAGQNNIDELTNHCMKNAEAISAFKPNEFDDKIFEELKAWQDKFV